MGITLCYASHRQGQAALFVLFPHPHPVSKEVLDNVSQMAELGATLFSQNVIVGITLFRLAP